MATPIAVKNSAKNSERPACAILICSFSLRYRQDAADIVAKEVLAKKKAQNRQDNESLELDQLHDDGRIGAVGTGDFFALMGAAHVGIYEPGAEDQPDGS